MITGPELARLSEDELRRLAPEVDVFARASPEDKLRLVEALQADGAVVAMTGDGVNDAPALKRADVGVAMGQKGTEAAKEAAEMVLADDNFASIAHAVEEGRTVYDNLKKSILFILPTNGGEALTIIAAITFGGVLPITPVQILWVNMVTAITLSVALAFERAEPDIMRRPPRDPGEPILSRFLVWRIAFVSALFLAGIYGLFLWARSRGLSIEEGRTLAVNALVAMQVFYLFNIRYLGLPSLTLRGRGRYAGGVDRRGRRHRTAVPVHLCADHAHAVRDTPAHDPPGPADDRGGHRGLRDHRDREGEPATSPLGAPLVPPAAA